MKTYSPKKSEIQHDWYIVDAQGLTLGRMATEVARVLRGKHKPTYSPNLDSGDHVIIINAEKVVLTSDKASKKMRFHHTGFPGGIKSETYAKSLQTKPAEAVRKSIEGMVPKNRLGSQQMTKLKVYAGEAHPHTAQKPKPLVIDGAKFESEK